jgi:hypothetical protein
MKAINTIFKNWLSFLLVSLTWMSQLFQQRYLLPETTNMIFLPYEVMVQIPIIYTDNRMQKSIDLTQETMAKMSFLFGGTSGFQTIGTYIDQTGKMVKDVNVFIKSYCDPDSFQEHLPTVISLVKEIGSQLDQESMLITINNVAYLIFINDNNQNA